MREISTEVIREALLDCVRRACFILMPDVRQKLEESLRTETGETGKSILRQLIKNAEIAAAESRPLCQDTGVAVVFLEIGQEIHLTGGSLEETVQAAVREAYKKFYLRKSLVDHPLNRKNTGDNTPAMIHTRIVPGDRMKIGFVAKGGGCENMSRIGMLTPSVGCRGVVDFVVQTVRDAGGNPCPPVVVGVGLGGNFEKAALLAKEALLRPLGRPAELPADRELERTLLKEVNDTGVGPMGLGGRTTALAVHVKSFPCHIAALPVAVNLDCHSHRHVETVL